MVRPGLGGAAGAVRRAVGRAVRGGRVVRGGRGGDPRTPRRGEVAGARDAGGQPAGPGGLRVEVVGADAGAVSDALAAAGMHTRLVGVDELDPDADVVVVADGRPRPAQLPRTPLRIGWVPRGENHPWNADLLEDLDEVLVPDDATATAVAPRSVARPHVRTGTDAADELATVLAAHRDRPRLAIVTGVSRLRMRRRWGDHHFAVATAKALRRVGWSSRVLCQGELDEHDLSAYDAVLQLAGKVATTPVAGVPTLAWVISHPDRITPAGVAGLDRVLVASDRVAAELADHGVPATALHQCTDPDRFRPTPGGPDHQLLFVGNSRGVRRRIIADLPAGADLAVYGYGWEPELLDPAHLHGDHVPNDELPAYYSAASIVLNDHWDAMREHAFPSNRLYDAAACGATLVSDHVDGLDELFDGGVTTYRTRGELAEHLEVLLADAGRRRELADRARAAVLARHTFDHRVAVLQAHLPAPRR